VGIITTLRDTKTVFPEVVTNDFINSMPRRELTPQERELPYARHYFKDMARIPDEDLRAVNRGPVDPSEALDIRDCERLLEDGYLPTETGYCVMPDGSGFAATKVFMPDVTPEMIDWWFNWHPLEDLRYAIWCPVAHSGISAKTPQAHLDSSAVPLHVRNIDKIHYPVEGFDLKGAQRIEIAFRAPEVLGISMERLDASRTSTFAIATVASIGPRVPINVFFHAIREVPGGIEYRSRYWLKYAIKNGMPRRSRAPFPTKGLLIHMARANCIHSLTEYNNLASILPDVYAEMNGPAIVS
jgi:hypothetical protein